MKNKLICMLSVLLVMSMLLCPIAYASEIETTESSTTEETVDTTQNTEDSSTPDTNTTETVPEEETENVKDEEPVVGEDAPTYGEVVPTQPQGLGAVPVIVSISKDGRDICGYIHTADAEIDIDTNRIRILDINYANQGYVDNKDASKAIKDAYSMLTSDDFNIATLCPTLGEFAATQYEGFKGDVSSFEVTNMFYVGMPSYDMSTLLNSDGNTFTFQVLNGYSYGSDVVIALVNIDGVWTPCETFVEEDTVARVTIPHEGVVVLVKSDINAQPKVEEKESNISIPLICAIVAAIALAVGAVAVSLTRKNPQKNLEDVDVKKDEPQETIVPDTQQEVDDDDDDDDDDD